MLMDNGNGGGGGPVGDPDVRRAALRLLRDNLGRMGAGMAPREATALGASLSRTSADEILPLALAYLTVAESMGLPQDGPDARALRRAFAERGLGIAPGRFQAD